MRGGKKKKRGIFCRTAESVAMTPKSRDHMPTTSLWGVAAKWPTRAPKTKLILCPRDPQGYSRISLSLSGRIFKWKSTGTSCQLRSKPHAVFHGICEIALTEVLATQMSRIQNPSSLSISLSKDGPFICTEECPRMSATWIQHIWIKES